MTSARLPLGDAVSRFRDNDVRIDILTNGTDTESYVTTGGDSVPSIRKFMKDTAADVTDLRDRLISYLAYSIVVESSAGTHFRVGESRSTTLNGRVFSNGTEVTNDIPAARFRWRRVSVNNRPPPNDDATWNAVYATGYRSITVDVDVFSARATFFCEITDGT